LQRVLYLVILWFAILSTNQCSHFDTPRISTVRFFRLIITRTFTIAWVNNSHFPCSSHHTYLRAPHHYASRDVLNPAVVPLRPEDSGVGASKHWPVFCSTDRHFTTQLFGDASLPQLPRVFPASTGTTHCCHTRDSFSRLFGHIYRPERWASTPHLNDRAINCCWSSHRLSSSGDSLSRPSSITAATSASYHLTSARLFSP